jgi:cell division transport system permease protein
VRSRSIRPTADGHRADVVKGRPASPAPCRVSPVRPYSKDESARLLEPWLGTGLALDDLPIPRIIVVRLAPDALPNFGRLQSQLAEQVPGASLDDHRGFIDRMRAMARAAVFGGVGVLVLVLIATILSVTFATRGAMATNRPVIEVLHFTGAKSSFIAGHFQRRFLIGLEGGAIGGGAIALARSPRPSPAGSPARRGRPVAALFGTLDQGDRLRRVAGRDRPDRGCAAVASRVTVNRTLDTIH